MVLLGPEPSVGGGSVEEDLRGASLRGNGDSSSSTLGLVVGVPPLPTLLLLLEREKALPLLEVLEETTAGGGCTTTTEGELGKFALGLLVSPEWAPATPPEKPGEPNRRTAGAQGGGLGIKGLPEPDPVNGCWVKQREAIAPSATPSQGGFRIVKEANGGLGGLQSTTAVVAEGENPSEAEELHSGVPWGLLVRQA